MNALKRIAAMLFLFLGSTSLSAQEKGVIKFLVDVDNGYFEIEINDSMLLKRYKDTLPEGTYSAKVWSPGYVVYPIDFTIIAGQTAVVEVDMVKNNNFMQYEVDYQAYRNQFHKQLTIPATVSLVTALTTGVFMVNAYTLKKRINTNITLYNATPRPEEIAELKTKITQDNKLYNRRRASFYVGTGLTAAFIGGTIWSYMNFTKNNIEPDFIKDSPFSDKYSFNITPLGGSFIIKL